mgnify:CR=1 FL=1
MSSKIKIILEAEGRGIKSIYECFFSSIILWIIGVRINSMAKPIFPPLTTMLVGLDMNES